MNEDWLRYELSARFSIEMPTPPMVYSPRSTAANIADLLDAKISVSFFDGCISGKLLVDALGIAGPVGQPIDQRIAMGMNRRRIERSAGAPLTEYAESTSASGMPQANGNLNFRGLPSTCTLAATKSDHDVLLVALICPRGDANLATASKRILESVEIRDTDVDIPRAQPVNLGEAASVLDGRALTRPRPAYPLAAKKAGVEGAVKVELVVSNKGRVLSAKVLSGPPVFYEVCEAAAKQWTFTPTIVDGFPATIRGQVTFNFRANE